MRVNRSFLSFARAALEVGGGGDCDLSCVAVVALL
eukprot:CAMPEP_0185747432 /NCGR_PEP_ID=MMETSP1174-20130828/6054_1 /TAXON_ID=35687 /ORGANISM="Dictyocha speculum, Strain CCMP1381" /LENGTH=34 /DNA_ID= /DNA_START= /DNA_END= /DNA_ORIENTATION=